MSQTQTLTAARPSKPAPDSHLGRTLGCDKPYVVDATWTNPDPQPGDILGYGEAEATCGSLLEVWERYGPHTRYTSVRVFWRRFVEPPGEEPRYEKRLLCARGGAYTL